jgi:hypothetical protein
MASVSDSLDFATILPDLKAWLGIDVGDTSEDARLERWFDLATAAADRFLTNPFQDAEGNDLPIPKRVETGVFAYIESARTAKNSGRTSRAGLASVTTGSVSETYAGDRGWDSGLAAHMAARDWWLNDRLKVWR